MRLLGLYYDMACEESMSHSNLWQLMCPSEDMSGEISCHIRVSMD